MHEMNVRVFSPLTNTFCEKEYPLDFPFPAGSLISPGFADVHTHGIGGFEFEDASPERIKQMLSLYAHEGTLMVMPTLGTVKYEKLLSATDNILAAAVETETKAGYAAVLGVHFECRYLSPVKAGAHDPSLLKNPDADEALQLIEKIRNAENALGRKLYVHFTIAPELKGAIEFISIVKQNGATVGIGHTDADATEAEKALDAGAVSFTHLFNAFRPLHHRTSSALSAALTGNAYTEFICDGKHLIWETVKLISALKKPDRTVLITDSVGAMLSDGTQFEFLSHKAHVQNGIAVYDDGTIAGSVITMLDALKNYIRYAKAPPEWAFRSAVTNPLNMINAGGILKNFDSRMRDFVAMDKEYNIISIYQKQQQIR